MNESVDLQSAVHRSAGARMATSAQLSACNRHHETDARLARFLLMITDRSKLPSVSMMQQQMAHALGVRRTTLTNVCGLYVKAKILTPRCGTMHIEDRERLERSACECYSVCRSIFDELRRDGSDMTTA